MSAAETHDVLSRYAKAWMAMDVATVVALYADDFTIHYGGANRLTGTHAGKEAALKALLAFNAATGRRLVEVVEIVSGETRGGLVVREAFTAPEGEVMAERIVLLRARDGLLRECWLYDFDQALVDRLIGA